MFVCGDWENAVGNECMDANMQMTGLRFLVEERFSVGRLLFKVNVIKNLKTGKVEIKVTILKLRIVQV
jgi:hypothetical protein